MTSYRAYGIQLVSDVPLPELAADCRFEAEATANLVVRLNIARRVDFDPEQTFLRADSPDGEEWLICSRTRGGYVLRFVGLADFFVDHGGDTVECCGIEPVSSPEVLRHLLLDAVIPRVLDLRGLEAIHATAVSIDGAACAFLGPAGAGKSTVAANLALAGAPMLGDDCVVLSAAETVTLIPGYAGARLWDDSFEALGIDSPGSKAAANDGCKRRVPELGRQFSAAPRPLKRIYRLYRDEDESAEQIRPAAVEDLRPAESLIELASASFRFDPSDRIRNRYKFEFLRKVVALVPVKRLVVPNDFAMLPAVHDLIARDLAGEIPAGARSLTGGL